VSLDSPDCWRICFDTLQRAITPGQLAVFYQGDQVVGSAVIGVPGTVPGAITP
jgi:tRNA U34 2-thiouridine synthase MnmA/TrmU